MRFLLCAHCLCALGMCVCARNNSIIRHSASAPHFFLVIGGGFGKKTGTRDIHALNNEKFNFRNALSAQEQAGCDGYCTRSEKVTHGRDFFSGRVEIFSERAFVGA